MHRLLSQRACEHASQEVGTPFFFGSSLPTLLSVLGLSRSLDFPCARQGSHGCFGGVPCFALLQDFSGVPNCIALYIRNIVFPSKMYCSNFLVQLVKLHVKPVHHEEYMSKSSSLKRAQTC